MAQKQFDYNGSFTLNSTWSCTTRYEYTHYGEFSKSTSTQSNSQTATNTVSFDISGLPRGAKALGARVHAEYTTGLYGGTFQINDISIDDDGFVTLDLPDFSTGSIDVKFSWKASVDPSGSDAHSSEYPTYNGTNSQSVTYSHSSPSDVSKVYLLVEYELRGIVYRADGGVLVPYQIYHAENGELIPYQLFKCVSTEEELSRIAQCMQDEYKQANVDLLNRPQVDWTVMNAAGWDTPEGSYSTVDTVTYMYNDFGLSGDYAINVTPILDDGTVIDGGVDGLWQYISDELNNDNQLEDLDIFLGKYNTVEEAEAAAQRLHELQEDYYALKEETAENILIQY